MNLLSMFDCEPSKEELAAKHQADVALQQQQRSQWQQLHERQTRFNQTAEDVFDQVTHLAGGAPTQEAAGTIWQMVMDEKLTCEAIAHAVVDKGQVAVSPQARIDEALNIAMNNKEHDGSHHKDWCIDQMCRVLAGETYRDFVKEACDGEDGPATYGWDVGTPP